ncbi:MAG: ADP-forming succinate--CoA ligase subunit beta [SAR324 cluster bacterium]|nr:ADP-forming succinate--CoA ligase subunit beta [SAR324 cluster bacterium]
MKIHEYQGKEILSRYGVAVPKAIMAETVEDAVKAAEEIGGEVWVVKAQIHAGGRGKGGGVKLSKGLEAVRENAAQILGMQLVTHQTGPAGQEVKKVLIEEGMDIREELYLSMLVDRESQSVVILASTEGGMDIEEVAAKTPGKILRETIDPTVGVLGFQALRLARGLRVAQVDPKLVRPMSAMIGSLYRAFIAEDCSLLEINPLVLTNDLRVVALDAKVTFDDNALFRHQTTLELRDLDEEEPLEIEASQADLSYIKLDGDIGCMVNGAGLAMATMDIIKLYGGEPANFLDVGGSATKERVTTAFKLILSDSNVEGILVNIFGGIMRCDVIAEGVVSAAREVSLNVPLVVRLEGTNVELGKKILDQSGLPIVSADDLGDAAEKVVKEVKEAA